MKRKHALDHIRAAGYHDDQARATRVYLESRLSFEAYIEAFYAGKNARRAGVACTCRECSAPKEG